jgi:hypothetical protein
VLVVLVTSDQVTHQAQSMSVRVEILETLAAVALALLAVQGL